MKIKIKPEGKIIEGNPEKTLLELSNDAGISHTHACGGQGRCSTCRVIILEGEDNLSDSNEIENDLKQYKKLPKNVRLACQTKPKRNVTFRRLVLDLKDQFYSIFYNHRMVPEEKNIAVLFADIRGYTSFTEKNLPYDVIHILNRYFYSIGEEIIKNNGYIDKYMGDGILAIFGYKKVNPKEICTDAIRTSINILKSVETFNQYLYRNFSLKFEIGIGIHYGHALIAEIGHPSDRHLTIIGDTVNTSSRIESLTKDLKVNILISDDIYNLLKEDIIIGKTEVTNIRGKDLEVKVYEVIDLKENDENLDKQIRLFINDSIDIYMVPSILRLVFHSSTSYIHSEKKGGFDGSIFYDASLVSEKTLFFTAQFIYNRYNEFLERFKIKFSLSDFFAYITMLAYERVGGLCINSKVGRIDSDEINRGELPLEEWNLEKLKNRFLEMGFDTQEFVVLSGAHTLGSSNSKSFTNSPFRLTNQYFIKLLSNSEDHNFLKSDLILLSNPETLKYVKKYACDNEKFVEDFGYALLKMTMVGQNIKDN